MKIALALGNADWESDFIAVISHPMLNLKVVRRCVDGIDLLAAVQVNEIEVVIVTDETLRLDDHAVFGEDASGFGVFDHGFADAILDGAEGVKELAL